MRGRRVEVKVMWCDGGWGLAGPPSTANTMVYLRGGGGRGGGRLGTTTSGQIVAGGIIEQYTEWQSFLVSPRMEYCSGTVLNHWSTPCFGPSSTVLVQLLAALVTAPVLAVIAANHRVQFRYGVHLFLLKPRLRRGRRPVASLILHAHASPHARHFLSQRVPLATASTWFGNTVWRMLRRG
uniref:Uncharacterized protein n=1 Tax=Cacopsylla melanoneura TaxID=428564 RepID=A0A8D8QDG5_9HEMI